MKRLLMLAVVISAMIQVSCKKIISAQDNLVCKENGVVVNLLHPMKDSVDAIVARYIAKGIPGIQVAVKNNHGWYITSGGYARSESRDTMNPCSPGWFFSLTKSYTAALIMKQYEKGAIHLDQPINSYLPQDVSEKINGAGNITVRMLLNHSSGLLNFTELPEYLNRQFTDPANQPSFAEMIEMVANRDLLSTPGTKYFYSNTNYLLLYIMLENVSGKPYKQLLQQEILNPLQLHNTYYDLNVEKATALKFPNYYFDATGSGQLQNVTTWNHYLGNASYGWGGIAGTPVDAILFYEALMKGKVVKQSSLQQMTDWFQGEDSETPNYGLGIEYWQFLEGSTPQRGHEGDGVGNSTMILYVPDNNTYLFINCTAGRLVPGPFLFKITDFKNELGKYVAGWR